MKPGYKTTEFYLTILSIVCGLLMSSGLIMDGGTAHQIIGILAAALASAGYGLARGLAKGGKGDA